jgi:hypothetical protein
MKKLLLLIFTYQMYAIEVNMAFLALENDQWKIFKCIRNNCKVIKTQMEVKSFDLDFKTDKIIYIGIDEKVRLIWNGQESILLESLKNGYIQPSFGRNSGEILLVQTINKSSKKTKIVSVDLESKVMTILNDQNTTTLEPFFYKDHLYYTKVSSDNRWEQIVQDIWVKDLRTRKVEQITDLNTISHQATVGKKYIYFSSKNSNGYHIYSKKLLNSQIIKQLTFNNVVDSYPKVYQAGVLFIRKTNNQDLIMKIDSSGMVSELKLDKVFKKIRELRIEK